jgi:hypothetical protein
MGLGNPYATQAQLAERLGTDDDGTFEGILDAASRAVESFTRRQFNRLDDDYQPPSRRYRALDCERCPVDDFWTLDDLVVEVAGTVWAADSVDARPWNAPQDGWPYFDLFAVGRSWPQSRRPLITVTAQWGWETVPAAIVEATLDVAEMMSLTVTSGQGAIRSESVAGYSVSFATPSMSALTENVPPELVKALPYRRVRFGVA